MNRLRTFVLTLCFVLAVFSQKRVIYSWNGAENSTLHEDVLLTLDADESSSTYGQVLSAASFGTKDNEPHHMGMTKSQEYICGGGLLSFFHGQAEIYCFEIKSNPLEPTLVWTLDVPLLACPDEFRPYRRHWLVVSMMCNDQGGSPGGIVMINPSTRKYQYFVPTRFQENPAAYWNAKSPDSNPHGIFLSTKYNRLVWSDYILPSSAVAGPVISRDTVNIYTLDLKQHVRTINLTGAGGLMDVNFLEDQKGWAISCGNTDHLIYTYWIKNVRHNEPTVNIAYNLTEFGTGASAGVMSTFGSRVIAPYIFQKLLYFDTTDVTKFKLLDMYDFGSYVGAHYTRLTKDNKNLLVINYFLDMGSKGVVHLGGDMKIHLFKVTSKKLKKLDMVFDMTTVYDYSVRPHAALFHDLE